EHDLRRPRRFALGHRGRTARQDDGLRREFRDSVRVGVERPDLAVDALLAHAPRDELSDLRAEIEDEDAVGHRGGALIPESAVIRKGGVRNKVANAMPALLTQVRRAARSSAAGSYRGFGERR